MGERCTCGTYRWVDAAQLRASAHLGDVVPRWWPGSDRPLPDDAGQTWVGWLAEVWARDPVAAALAVASPVLAARVAAVCDGARLEPAQVRRVALAVARYLVRMRGRATPFGLFAGVAPLRFGDRAAVRWSDEHRVRRRPDAAWLAAVIDRLEGCPDLRRRLTVVRCNTATVRGSRLVAAGATGFPSSNGPQGRVGRVAVSVRYSAAVRLVMQLTGTPVAVGALIEKVAVSFPGGALPVIEAMVADLVRCGVLISCLRPSSTVVDPLAHLVDRLHEIDAADLPEAAAVLTELNDIAERAQPVGRAPGPPTTRCVAHTPPPPAGCAADRGGAVRAGAARGGDVAWAVDLGLTGEFVVPELVAGEAAAAAEALLRLSPAPHGHPGWLDYHSRFLDRYGAGAVIALDQLVDPTTGLGLPQHFSPPTGAKGIFLSERDEYLLEMAQQAAWDGAREVVLDDARLDALCAARTASSEPGGAAGPVRLPAHVDLCVEVRASTAAALTAGEFTLAVTGIGRTGIATSGRFLDLLPEHDQRRVVAALAGLPVAVHTAVAVQLSFAPWPMRVGNVTRVRPVLPETLSVGEYHDPAATPGLTVEDLAVTADHQGMYVISPRRGQVVEPTLVNAAARHTMAPLVRMLAELPQARTAAVSLFDWGAAGCLPFLPRLRYGRSVLAGARWRLDPGTLPGPETTQSAWAAGLGAVRQRLRLPDTVAAGSGNRRLRLDLDEPMEIALLREHLNRPTGPVTLTEAATPADHGWLGGRAHEIVIPLATSSPPAPAPAAVISSCPGVVIDREHGDLPGSQMLSARLDCHPDVVDTILTRHLPELLTRWDDTGLDISAPDTSAYDTSGGDTGPRWWFLRYRTPVPHLRLRLHVDDYGLAADRVGAWATELRRQGLTGDLVLDTYRAELARYTLDGAPEAMAAAEAVFAADSVAVRAQLLAAARHDALNPVALTAASMLDLASALAGGRRAGAAWLVRRADLAAHARIRDRGLLVQVRDLCPVPGIDTASVLGDAGAALGRAWQARRRAISSYIKALAPPGGVPRDAIVASLLHLHHVRGIGVDPETEALCHRLARSAALAIVAREAASPRPSS